MDGGWRRAPGAMPARGNPDAGGAVQGARTLGYLGSFQVTRRRRNSLAVRTNPGRAADISDTHRKPSAPTRSVDYCVTTRSVGTIKKQGVHRASKACMDVCS